MISINQTDKVGTRDGDLDENSTYPPTLSQDGQLFFSTNVHLLESLEQLVRSKVDAP